MVEKKFQSKKIDYGKTRILSDRITIETDFSNVSAEHYDREIQILEKIKELIRELTTIPLIEPYAINIEIHDLSDNLNFENAHLYLKFKKPADDVEIFDKDFMKQTFNKINRILEDFFDLKLLSLRKWKIGWVEEISITFKITKTKL